MSDLIYASSAGSIPKEVVKLAEKLERLHGQVSIHRESNGIHLHLPDPELLETDGYKELNSRHLTVNAEKYLGIGRYDVDNYPTNENHLFWRKYRSLNKEVPCASSMKTGKQYSVDMLLHMLPIEKRGLNFDKIRHGVIKGSNGAANLVDDGTGTMVPDWCGVTVPLSLLDVNHPAAQYMINRGFDLINLSDVFGLCYCTSAAPENRAKEIYYPRLAGNLKNTHEGRIIIPVWMDGHRTGYQSRVIDLVDTATDSKYIWQNNKFNPIKKNGVFLYPEKEIKIQKYRNATGSSRNNMLFGYDQAVRWNKLMGNSKENSIAILVEGPLDAAKIGPPAIAMLGKSLSDTQSTFIKKAFGKIITVGDQDKAGREAVKDIHSKLQGYPIDDLTVPYGKDAGALSYDEARNLVKTSYLFK